jgi:hypothetical protein
MKTVLFYQLVLVFSVVAGIGYSQDAITLKQEAADKEIILQSCDGYLKSAVQYSATVGCIEIIGGGLFAIGLSMQNDNESFIAVGFLIGFGGMEMSKFIPVPLTKARRDLDLLRPSWKDSLEYIRIHQKVVAAETLGYTTMALAFAGQALVLAAAFSDQNNSTQTVLLATGITFAIASVGTCIGSTVMAQMARVDLGKSHGSIGLCIGPQGIGAVYKLP